MVERQSPVSLRRQCVLLGLSRAALYYRPVQIGAYQLELMHSSTANIYGRHFTARAAWRRGLGLKVTRLIASASEG